MNEQSLFLRALEQPAGEPRRNWLEQECENPDQRTRIAALLARHDNAGNFLEKPPAELSVRNHASTSANVKPITKAKFIDRLIRSKLMTAEDVAECESTLESVQAESDALSFAHAMVRANKLTGFQAKAICDGRIKGLTFGEYIILDRLGKGGMGIVYKAKHRRMDRLVAIKVLPRSTMATKGLEERFYREVKTAAKLMHPNIVAALDASEDDGLHYLVMEYVDGQDLGEVLRQSGPLQGEHAVNCIIQAARGLQYAHEQGVIHRDIKPANLLIDGNGTVKVLDMGLARVTGAASEGLDESSENDSAKVVAIDAMRSSCDIPATLSREHDTATINDQTRLTNAGEIMGTLAYMPPEQFTDSRNVDERGDIYSLGCTLYHLLTGQKPFHADTVAAIFKSHRSDPVPSLRSIRPDIPEDLDRVFQRMLAKEPEQRQSSMLQVIEELGESLSAMQRPQTIPVGPSQKESSNRELYTNTFGVASSDSPAGSPQIVLSHDHPVRRGRRNRLGWISAGMAVCALLLIGVLMFVQKSGQGKRSLASSTSMNLLTDATDMHKAARMTAKQHPQGNISAKLPTHHDVDGRINRPQDIEDEVPNVNDKNPKEFDNPTQQSNQNAVDNRVGKPMDWIGGTTWSTGFEFQEGSSFGPSANRQVEFNDSGRKVSISEDSTGITVTVDGRVVKAANVAELSKKDAQAFQLYEKVFGVTDMEIAPAISAFDLQRMQLERLRETHSENPQLKSLIERMLPDNRK